MAGTFFWQNENLGISFSGVRYKQLVHIAVDRCFLHSQVGLNMSCQSMRAMSGNAMEREA